MALPPPVAEQGDLHHIIKGPLRTPHIFLTHRKSLVGCTITIQAQDIYIRNLSLMHLEKFPDKSKDQQGLTNYMQRNTIKELPKCSWPTKMVV